MRSGSTCHLSTGQTWSRTVKLWWSRWRPTRRPSSPFATAPFLLVGDFNLPEISWGTGEAVITRCSSRAVTFIDALTECEATQSVTSATRGESVLDLTISRGGVAISEVRDQLFASDHLVVDTRFAVTVGTSPRATRSRAYDYKRADFVGLRRALRLIPWHFLKY